MVAEQSAANPQGPPSGMRVFQWWWPELRCHSRPNQPALPYLPEHSCSINMKAIQYPPGLSQLSQASPSGQNLGCCSKNKPSCSCQAFGTHVTLPISCLPLFPHQHPGCSLQFPVETPADPSHHSPTPAHHLGTHQTNRCRTQLSVESCGCMFLSPFDHLYYVLCEIRCFAIITHHMLTCFSWRENAGKSTSSRPRTGKSQITYKTSSFPEPMRAEGT